MQSYFYSLYNAFDNSKKNMSRVTRDDKDTIEKHFLYKNLFILLELNTFNFKYFFKRWCM